MLRRVWHRGLLAASALSIVATGMTIATAEARTNRALIVAVTAYPNLPKKNWLVGPNHDAELVRDYLTTSSAELFDDENVIVLADGLDDAKESPTRAAVLANLKLLADEAEPDDFVYLHFSGHGSQQPELVSGTETDGLDEIFLPADTELWKDRGTGVPNALMDDEFGAALDAIRSKGAFVWFVIDACHSGTATREVTSDSADVMERELKPDDLGIPAEEMAEAERAAAPATRGFGEQTRESALMLTGEAEPQGATALKGGLVAFYAAQTTETTPERPMPRGQEGATSYGVFTYTLFQRMAENPNMTYRQLGQAILQQYAADNQTKPTPLFEGDLDARVFGTEKIDTVMQWPVRAKGDQIELRAGLLHNLAPGTKLALLPSPTSEMKEALGYLEVTGAKNLTSQARPVAFDGKPALQMAAIPAQAYARLLELAVRFELKVARPAANDQLTDEVSLVNKALDELAANPEKRFNVTLVEAGEDADLRLAVLRENQVDPATGSDTPALWFLPPSGKVTAGGDNRPPLVAIDVTNPQKLADATAANLQKIFRATSLARLSAASDYRPDQVSVHFMIKREQSDEMEPLDGSAVPYVNPGDQVHILAENMSSKRIDINILYIGSDYSITHITAQRLEAGSKLEEGLLAFTDDSFGLERMVAVLTDAPPGSETEDLSFLEQGKVPPATRAAGQTSAFSSMLGQIAEVPSTRGATAFKVNDGGAPKGGVMIFGIETQPRP
ncbi:MAG: caspase family protein [Rhizobiaceae bacterium]|nr:caspase family protein [Rhizobiaceae bacterium]